MQLALDDALWMDFVGDKLRTRCDLAAKFDFAHAQRTAAAGRSGPGHVKTGQLPHGVETEAAGHDGIAAEVALEEPALRIDVVFGDENAFAMVAAFGRHL